MSEDTLSHVQDIIRFCPVCGEESTKEFEVYTAYSGTWACTGCHEIIEVYLLEETEDLEEETEETNPSSSLPLMFIIACFIGFIYFSSL